MRNDMFIVLSRESEFSDKSVLKYCETEVEVHEELKRLSEIKTITNQSELEFAYVFPKGSLYPSGYEAFYVERRNKSRVKYEVVRPYYVERKLKNGKVKQKFYDFAEDFDWQFSDWIEEVVILNLNEALRAEFVYERDVLQQWGDRGFVFGGAS